jgi:transcriptional regulator with XRE-family HTH domain
MNGGDIRTVALVDPTTRESLRLKAERLEDLVERSADEHPSAAEKLKARVERRWAWYRRLEDAVLDLVNTLPAGTEDYEARQLFVFLTELRRALDEDTEATDADGRVALAATRMGDVSRRLSRRLEHAALEDAGEAARYIFGQLDSMGVSELARLLGVSTKTIGAWRSGKPVKQKVDRVKLVAQLVFYLRYSMTPTGLVMWFDNEADLLGGRSPLQLIGESVAAAWEPLVSYARGGRGQLAG